MGILILRLIDNYMLYLNTREQKYDTILTRQLIHAEHIRNVIQ